MTTTKENTGAASGLSAAAGSNPYRAGVPIRDQVHINTAVLSGVIGPDDFKSNSPMTQEQADRLFEYRKRRHPSMFSNK